MTARTKTPVRLSTVDVRMERQSALRWWHPVARSVALGKKPIAVRIHGIDVAVFRTASGRIGAVEDRCPHRLMKLSAGWVEGEHVVCPYHAMKVDRFGVAHKPATPRMKACARHFEAIEHAGLVWLKRADSHAELPALRYRGFFAINTFEHVVDVPVELVIDNFAEVEHAATTHFSFGTSLDQMDEVEQSMELTEQSITVSVTMPQRKLPRAVEALGGLRTGDVFKDDFTLHFGPLYGEYWARWMCRETGRRRLFELRPVVFFVPETATRTRIFTILHVPSSLRLIKPALWALTKLVHEQEIRRDIAMLEKLADFDTRLSSMRLGRFDRALSEIRKRVERVYYGRQTTRSNRAASG
jgi:vanillate O-demethylase monooxygenase subunit